MKVAYERPETGRSLRFDFEAGRHVMNWRQVGEHHLIGTDRIGIRPAPDAEAGLVELPLVGPVLATLLHLRGSLVLHASAVSVNGAAHVLMGDEGAENPTTAGSLLATGHRLVADDVVAISSGTDGGPVIAPAFGKIKLSSAAAQTLGTKAKACGRVLDGTGKRAQSCPSLLSDTPVRLPALHVLSRGGGPRVQVIPAPGAVAHLTRFSFTRRFGRAALPPDIATRHFRQCAALAERAHDGLDRLAAVVAVLERGLEAP